jgi:hypothetical protein
MFRCPSIVLKSTIDLERFDQLSQPRLYLLPDESSVADHSQNVKRAVILPEIICFLFATIAEARPRLAGSFAENRLCKVNIMAVVRQKGVISSG